MFIGTFSELKHYITSFMIDISHSIASQRDALSVAPNGASDIQRPGWDVLWLLDLISFFSNPIFNNACQNLERQASIHQDYIMEFCDIK